MATRPVELDQRLAAAVARARAGLTDEDLPRKSAAGLRNFLGLDEAGKAAVARMLRDGTYARAGAAVVADDPELNNW